MAKNLESFLKLDFVGAERPQNQAFQQVLKHALGAANYEDIDNPHVGFTTFVKKFYKVKSHKDYFYDRTA